VDRVQVVEQALAAPAGRRADLAAGLIERGLLWCQDEATASFTSPAGVSVEDKPSGFPQFFFRTLADLSR
jgi:hypothetical protein